jgi:hypothetical protein
VKRGGNGALRNNNASPDSTTVDFFFEFGLHWGMFLRAAIIAQCCGEDRRRSIEYHARRFAWSLFECEWLVSVFIRL